MGRTVSASWIDTDRARRTAAAWAVRADAWFRTRFDLEGDVVQLQLSGGAATAAVLHHLSAASTELWVGVSFVRLVADRSESSDRLIGGDPATVFELWRRAGAGARSLLPPTGAVVDPSAAFSSRFGDLGQTYDAELRSPYSVSGSTPTERGRNVVLRALTDIGGEAQIGDDEFGLVRFAGGRYLVVLPGVTDLSGIDVGLDQRHRTVRDVDRYAYASSRSTSVDDNRYAAMVWDGLRAAGVPIGAQLMLVGHSYGADTALDLAADPRFNGAAGFLVTHVVAAGYHSAPQLQHVDPRTEVLVLQNSRDAVVIAEAVGYGPVTASLDDARSALGHLRDLDPAGVVRDVGELASDVADAAVAGAELVADRTTMLASAAVALVAGRPDRAVAAAVDAVALRPGVERVAERQVVDVFRGGFEGVGHAPANYSAHVAATGDPDVEAFFESVAAGGYAASGTAWAIDVSVPVDE